MEYLIFLRLIHIVSAVFWAGAIMYFAWFIIPAAKALGPDGAKFMQQLSSTNKLPVIMFTAGTLTIVGGILLIERLSIGFQLNWFGTSHGIVISIGGALALIAYVIGLSVNLPTLKRMGAIGKVIAASDAPPNPEQMQELQRLRIKLFAATNIMAILLLGATISMSIARYF